MKKDTKSEEMKKQTNQSSRKTLIVYEKHV